MDYQVVWMDNALVELGEVVKYIAKNNPIAAKRLGQAILDQVQMLSQFPRMGHRFAELHRDDVREISVRPYRIIYHIQDSNRSIMILMIRHGAMQEPDLPTDPLS
jgi:toxin ParE1/3/4